MLAFENYRALVMDAVQQPLPSAPNFKDALGRHTWNVLHTMAESYPCATCQPDFTLLVDGMHDTVNAKLGRPIFNEARYDQFLDFVNDPTREHDDGVEAQDTSASIGESCDACHIPMPAGDVGMVQEQARPSAARMRSANVISLRSADLFSSLLWGGLFAITIIGIGRSMESKLGSAPDAPIYKRATIVLPILGAIACGAIAFAAKDFDSRMRAQFGVTSAALFVYTLTRLT